MANRTFYPSYSFGVGRVYGEIKLKLNGASAPTILSGTNLLSPTAPPTHSGGTNVIGVTLRDTWLEVVGADADFRDDSATGAYATIGTIANEASPTQLPITFNMNTFTAGGSAQNNASGTYTIKLILRNSSESYGNNP